MRFRSILLLFGLALACTRESSSPKRTLLDAGVAPIAGTIGDASTSRASRSARIPTDVEMAREAELRVQKLERSDRSVLTELLLSPNPYERAYGLSGLAESAGMLDVPTLRLVLTRLRDPDAVYEGTCLQTLSSNRAIPGQGMMYLAAQCHRYHGKHLRDIAEKILKAAPWEAVLDALLTPPSRKVGLEAEECGLVNAMGSKAVPRWLLALATEQAPALERALDLGLRLPLGAGNAHSLHRLDELMSHPLASIRVDAALNALLLTDLPGPRALSFDSGIRLRAVESLVAALKSEEHGNVLGRLALARAAAAPLLNDVLQYADASGDGSEGPALVAIAQMGPRGQPAVDKLLAILARLAKRSARDAEVNEPFRSLLLTTLISVRPPVHRVQRHLIGEVRRHPEFLSEALAALVELRANVAPVDLRLLRNTQRAACADADSIVMFSLSREERCDDDEKALTALARRSWTLSAPAR